MILERFKQTAQRKTQVDWIVEDLISSGEWTYLVGEAGAGKSILMMQLVDALQRGEAFLGMRCKPRNCLYIQVDTGRLEWQQKVGEIAGESYAWTMYAMKDNFLDDEKEVDNVRRIVWGEYPKRSQVHKLLQGQRFDVVIFDVLNKLTAIDLNTKSGMSHVLNALSAITKRGEGEERESVHYVLVHHPSASVTRGVTAGSGYKGFGGLCGTMLTLYGNVLRLEKSKVVGKRELLLQRGEFGAWSLAVDYRQVDVPYQGGSNGTTSRSTVDDAITRSILGG